mgnify:CR=1 FL=1
MARLQIGTLGKRKALIIARARACRKRATQQALARYACDDGQRKQDQREEFRRPEAERKGRKPAREQEQRQVRDQIGGT